MRYREDDEKAASRVFVFVYFHLEHAEFWRHSHRCWMRFRVEIRYLSSEARAYVLDVSQAGAALAKRDHGFLQGQKSMRRTIECARLTRGGSSSTWYKSAWSAFLAENGSRMLERSGVLSESFHQHLNAFAWVSPYPLLSRMAVSTTFVLLVHHANEVYACRR